MKLWLRFAMLWLAVLLVTFAISFYVLPYGFIWFVGCSTGLVIGKQESPATEVGRSEQ